MNTQTTTDNKTLWVIDAAHSEVAFKVKHMMISTVRGHFDEFNATVETEGDEFENANVHVEINTASVNTKSKDRDGHLKSDDFFNSETYPNIIFNSKSFDGNTLIGDLTIRDVTKEVELHVENNGMAVDPYGQIKAGFEITGTINRKEFGLKWDAVTEAGSVVVSDKVTLVIDTQFIKK
ncbi:MAG: hypothetical protein GC181_07005 [Bacteroidetes bacterium]|nr:hypothetical protein [Bacteroidota bacterium]